MAEQEGRRLPEGWKEDTDKIIYRDNFCRVLASNDKNLKGRVGYVVQQDPLHVRLEGIAEPIAFERDQLDFMPKKYGFFVCGIFRHHIKEYDQFLTTFIGHNVDGGSHWMAIQNVSNRAKTNCCMMTLASFLKRVDLPCVFLLPDLNVSIALNKWCAGHKDGLDVRLDDSCEKCFREVTKTLKNHKHKIFFCYEPYYIKPDTDSRLAKERVAAVKNGAFLVYPSPVKLGNLEVTYAGETKIRQQRLADHGNHELNHYVQNAVLLKDFERLMPTVMAQVDPNTFWEACHNFRTMLNCLRDHACDYNDGSIVEAWVATIEGCMESVKALRMATLFYEVDKFVDLCADEEGLWKKGIFGQPRDHERIAWKLAKLSICIASQGSGEDVNLPVKLLDHYDGTELARMAKEINQAENVVSRVMVQTCYTSEESTDVSQLREELGMRGISDTTTCRTCGSKGKLQLCAKCKGAAYCSKDCQVKDWRAGGHKEVCKALSVATISKK